MSESARPAEPIPGPGPADGAPGAAAGSSGGFDVGALLAGVKPEQALGGAFAGGIVAALLLRRLRS